MSDKPDPIKLQKLPKWASDWIEQCERRCANAEKALSDYLDSQTKTNVFIRNGIDEKSYLQTDRIVFALDNGEISVRVEDGALECHASYGFGRLVVVPHVTNVVHLEIEADHD